MPELPTVYDSIKQRGVFWLPDAEEKHLHGELVRELGEAELNLFCSQTQITEAFGDFGQNAPAEAILLGRLEDGTLCTLARLAEGERRSGPMECARLYPDHLFLGAHFRTAADIIFSEAKCDFSTLRSFVFEGPIHEMSPCKTLVTGEPFSVTQTLPQGASSFVPSIDASVRIESHHRYSSGRGGFTLFCSTFIVVAPATPQPHEWFFKSAAKLQNLLTLLTGHSSYIVRLEGIHGRSPVGIYPNGIGREGRADSNAITARTTIAHVRQGFGELLAKWFSCASEEELGTTCNLFFSTRHTSRMFSEQRFLFLMQALEVFSRVKFGGLFVRPEAYDEVREKLVRAIPENTDDDLKNSLASRLKWGNERSLSRRMLDLLRSLQAETLALVCPHMKDYVKRCVDTRNYLTHYSEDDTGDRRTWSYAQLIYVSESLAMLLTILLHREVGISEADIRYRFSRYYATSSRIQHYYPELFGVAWAVPRRGD